MDRGGHRLDATETNLIGSIKELGVSTACMHSKEFKISQHRSFPQPIHPYTKHAGLLAELKKARARSTTTTNLLISLEAGDVIPQDGGFTMNSHQEALIDSSGLLPMVHKVLQESSFLFKAFLGGARRRRTNLI